MAAAGGGEEDLLSALEAREGVVAFVGAGGKKTILWRLAACHPGRLAVTTTVRMACFPGEWEEASLLGKPAELRERVPEGARVHRRVVYAGPPCAKGRLTGVPPELVPELQSRAGFDVTYVKADGARMRWMKAPGSGEPVLPAGATTVVGIVSARALGRPLDERVAHRAEQVTAVTGLSPGEEIRPEHIARLLTHADGLGKGSGGARFIPVINMVDDAELERGAREAAEKALSGRQPRVARVVLASMKRDRPLVERLGD